MPPRSVCLNVFTTSLSHAVPKESNVSIKEVDSDVDMKEKEAAVIERARHDSVQSSPNDIITSAPYSVPVAEPEHPSAMSADKECGIATLREHHAAMTSFNNARVSVCQTCGQSPPAGSSLQRCSRCKAVYYCSKMCQKAAWKLHRLDCGSLSAIATPDISTPGSPTNMQESSVMIEASPSMRRLPQSTDDWMRSNGGDAKLRLSVSDNVQYEDLRDLLICGYCVYANENGGVAPTRDDMLDEFKLYVDAANERVDTGGILDAAACKSQIQVDVVNALQNGTSPLLKEVTSSELMSQYGAELLDAIGQIQKVVYGSKAVET